MTSTPGSSARRDREERITASGIRLIGAAGRMISDAAAAGLARPAHEDDLLYAATFQLRPRLGTATVNQALAVLSQAMTRAHPEFRPLDRDAGTTDMFGRFHAAQWQVATGAEQWTGELLWRHPHPTVPGVATTTHAVLSERPGLATLTLRVGTPGGLQTVCGPVGVGQAYPSFLAELNRTVRLVFDRLDADPRVLGEHDIEDFVSTVLVGEDRPMPVAVLAPTETGEYLVPPSELAEELIGVAHLYVMDRHPTTYRLSDALGDRRLSCYWGALRAYLPGFSCADRPSVHPLLVADRVVDPVVRAQVRGTLCLAGRSRIPEPAGVETLRSPERPKASGGDRGKTGESVAPSPASSPPVPADAELIITGKTRLVRETMDRLERRVDQAIGALDRLLGLNATLIDEVTALRANNAVRGASTTGLERRLRDIERLLREQFGLVATEVDQGREDEDILGPDGVEEEDADVATLAAAVRQAAVAHDDALLVLDDAVRTAEESPYRDADRAAAVLDAMALVARRRQAGTLGTSLRDAFRDLGVDYRRGISDGMPERMRQQYSARLPNGEVVEAAEHIALGVSYDPRHCLRIYFTSRVPAEPRFVIAHVGRHLDGIST